MIIGMAMLIGVAVAWALGARLGRLAALDFRGDALVFAALGLQLVIFTPLGERVPAAWHQPAHLLSYAMVVGFLLLNLRVSGFWLAGVGVATNTLAVAVNGGRMPVSLAAWRATGADPGAITRDGGYNNNVLAGAHTHLAWLGDVFALPPTVPLATALSIGDVLIVIGMTAFVYRSCVPRIPHASAGMTAALRYPQFRRVLAGRVTSKLGDWLTMTAIVTWVYSVTQSTQTVAAFLLVRILASIVGSAASAPLLVRTTGFRVLSLVELMRGVATLAMLPFALSGHIVPVIALVCLSCFLGAATNPSASGLVPEVLPSDLLQAGNALHGVARNLTAVLGAVLGGVSVSQFGIGTALAIDLATFVAAGLLYLRFAGPPAEPDQREAADPGRRELLAAALSNRVVVGLVLSFTVVTVAMGALNSSLPDFFFHQLGTPQAYGYAMASITLGLMSGEFLTGFIRRESVARRSVYLAFAAMAAMALVLSHSTVAATAYLLLFLIGVADGTTEVVYDTLFQRNVPRRVLSGSYAMAAAVQNGGQVAGFGLAVALTRFAPATSSLRVAAATCGIGAVLAGVALFKRIPESEDVLDDAEMPLVARLDKTVIPLRFHDPIGKGPVALDDLVATGAVVLVLLGSDADSAPREAMVRQLARGRASVIVVTRGESKAARRLTVVRAARWLTDPTGEAFRTFAMGRRSRLRRRPHRSGVFVVDAERVLRLSFTAEGPDRWISESPVLSRLARLGAPPASDVQVVRTTLSPASGGAVPEPA
jgi:Na+/melibiose symporter-like transporter